MSELLTLSVGKRTYLPLSILFQHYVCLQNGWQEQRMTLSAPPECIESVINDIFILLIAYFMQFTIFFVILLPLSIDDIRGKDITNIMGLQTYRLCECLIR